MSWRGGHGSFWSWWCRGCRRRRQTEPGRLERSNFCTDRKCLPSILQEVWSARFVSNLLTTTGATDPIPYSIHDLVERCHVVGQPVCWTAVTRRIDSAAMNTIRKRARDLNDWGSARV